MTLPRASSLARGATESSRSMNTSSAGRPEALPSIFGDEPGTERHDRRGLVTRVLMCFVPFACDEALQADGSEIPPHPPKRPIPLEESRFLRYGARARDRRFPPPSQARPAPRLRRVLHDARAGPAAGGERAAGAANGRAHDVDPRG